jgi:hypothetical protein
LITANYVALPLSPDIFSLQGLRTLGPTLNRWRKGWSERLDIWQALSRRSAEIVELPAGTMEPAGYIVLQHALRLDHPINAYDQWMTRIPAEYRQFVLHETPNHDMPSATSDQYCLALLKHYRTLLPLAQEAHKPIFHLKPADGAVGSIMQAAQSAYQDFRQLAVAIARRVNIPLPQI